MLVRKMKKILAVFLLLTLSASAFAVEEYVSDIYLQIDACFAAKDEAKLNSLLAANIAKSKLKIQELLNHGKWMR